MARFRGLGKWPLTIDEYYLAQSVQNILHSGLPRYPCGGLYVRGLLLQYCAAALQLAGLSPEMAPRLIAAVCNLASLPALYLIARRVGGRTAGLLAVALMAVSVWEVEVARFGRMYAPFQAVFLWYVVFFLRYTLEGGRRALMAMLTLSVAGVFIWEGGIFLSVTNLLPPFIRNPQGRLSRADWGYLAASALLCIPGFYLATANLRAGAEPILPSNYRAPADISPSRLDAAVMPWTTLHLHPAWMLLATIPLLLSVLVAIRVIRSRTAPLPTLGTLAFLCCTLLQQFGLALALLLIMLLLSIRTWSELRARSTLSLYIACAANLLFWISFGSATHDWHAPQLPTWHSIALLGYEFVRFPDVIREVAAPWLRTVPHLTIVLAALLGASCLYASVRSAAVPGSERILLALLVLLLLAAGASNPPRHETRYVFFLYPLAVALAIIMVGRVVRWRFEESQRAATITALLVLAGFALTEDFQPQHLRDIDSEEISLRLGMSQRLTSHYQARTDTRAAARWLMSHAQRPADLVVSSFPGFDFYYPYSDYYLMEDADARFESWSCARGRYVRWSNLPLLRSPVALDAQIATGRRVWLVIETDRLEALLQRLHGADWHEEWRGATGDIAIVTLRSTANSTAGAGT
ncbi:MAG TPA: glycosyltransferase family 39 protein [Steroidobacteraceae bacterium]|nr:glycosyltransferase family 39 protein [Steroidobacteraceae bacterium]